MKSIDKMNHGFVFSKDVKPTLHCDLGETVNFQTLDCFSNSLLEEGTVLGIDNPNNSNPITGPLYVNGVTDKDSLIIEVVDIELDSLGIALVSNDSEAFQIGNKKNAFKRINVEESIIYLDKEIELHAEPMIGTIGLAPKGDPIPSALPGNHGGNMDCRFVKKGSLICLPVFVDGAYISMGDVHALMGDGELGECGLEIGSNIKIRTRKQKRVINIPYIIDQTTVMVIASDKDIYQAINLATKNMVDLVIDYLGFDVDVANHLVNLKGNIGICQICNRLKTVRMEIDIEGLADKILMDVQTV